MEYEITIRAFQKFFAELPLKMKVQLFYVACLCIYFLSMRFSGNSLTFYDGFIVAFTMVHIFNSNDAQSLQIVLFGSTDLDDEEDTPEAPSPPPPSPPSPPPREGLAFYIFEDSKNCGIKVVTKEGRSYCWKFSDSSELKYIANSSYGGRITHIDLRARLEFLDYTKGGEVVLMKEVNPWELSPNYTEWMRDFQLLY